MSDDPNEPTEQIEVPADARFAIVWSRFNLPVVSRLLDGARDCLTEHGVSEEAVYVAEVPGAWELSHAARQLARSDRFDAIIALGAVIRGGTPHFDYVCDGATQGLLHVMLETGLPIAFGVLTTDDDQQAFDRAGGSHGNKGRDAALTAIEMVLFDRKLENDGIPTKRA
jgi:6,7-dimethyl-8-ribityllumazine synthase